VIKKVALQHGLKYNHFDIQFPTSDEFSIRGEVTELVPVPAFKAAVTVREYGEVSSILMLSRQSLLSFQ
jgi:3-oxoacyl-[acyl-carrier-protein] synthase III